MKVYESWLKFIVEGHIDDRRQAITLSNID